ncbi:hypothetical protein ACRWUP_25900, partial [Escherichia coli]
TLKMPAFEWVHVQLHQQKGMISLSPPTICNSAKPCTVSQPACRNHARQSGVSTPSATTSIVVFRRRLH